MTIREERILPDLAVNVTEVASAGTVTEAGTARRLLPDETVMTLPPAGAALFSVMTQLLVDSERMDVGLQTKDARAEGPSRVRVAVLEIPLNVAVTVTDWLLAMVPAVAWNVAEDDPAGMLMEAGTVSHELLSERFTITPPAGAAEVRLTVQALTAPDEILDGAH